MADLIGQNLVQFNTPEQGLENLTVVIKPDIQGDDPSELREYIVIVKKGFTIADLAEDLRRDTSEDDGVDSSMVPDRPVTIANHRPLNDRQTHFMMTWAEAQALKNHPQVLNVELADAIQSQIAVVSTQNFEKQPIFASNVGSATNYALYRCNFQENIYQSNTGGVADFAYNLDGTDVDVVIMDNGVHPSHPEWEGPNGRNRFVQIDWYQAAGVSGTMPSGYYDIPADGHGTCVASIVAGKTYGWARNANIYSLKTLGSGATIGPAEGLDLVRQWHQNKLVNPKTGFKNPTIVNASWDAIAYTLGAAVGGDYDPYQGHTIYTGYQIWDGEYRGNAWNSGTIGIGTYTMPKQDYALGMTIHSTDYSLGNANVVATLYKVAGKNDAVDEAVEALIEAGVTFVHSAGNDRFKADLPNGPDWENYANVITSVDPLTLQARYYCRPNSPWANGVVQVGGTDTDVYSANLEKRAYFSHYGPAVDIHAPSVGIVGASVSGEAYYANSSYYQVSQQGTSFAAPCVAGVMTLALQANPHMSPAQAKQWLLNNGSVANVIYDTGSDSDYSNIYSLSGGPNQFLYNPYNKAATRFGLTGSIVLANTVPTAAATANIIRPSDVPPAAPASTYSVYFDGSSYLTVTNNSKLAMGTSNFTAEGWVYFIQMRNYQALFDQRTPGNGAHITIFGYGLAEAGIMPDNGNFDSGVGDLVLANTWYHLALTRSSGTMRLYVDGTLVASASGYTSDINNQNLMYIGSTDAGHRNLGYISNFRLIDGTALYTGSSFTVPTAPLANVAGTICLACQNGSQIIDSTGQMTFNTFGNPAISTFNPIDNP
jgi:hypothetical protein